MIYHYFCKILLNIYLIFLSLNILSYNNNEIINQNENYNNDKEKITTINKIIKDYSIDEAKNLINNNEENIIKKDLTIYSLKNIKKDDADFNDLISIIFDKIDNNNLNSKEISISQIILKALKYGKLSSIQFIIEKSYIKDIKISSKELNTFLKENKNLENEKLFYIINNINILIDPIENKEYIEEILKKYIINKIQLLKNNKDVIPLIEILSNKLNFSPNKHLIEGYHKINKFYNNKYYNSISGFGNNKILINNFFEKNEIFKFSLLEFSIINNNPYAVEYLLNNCEDNAITKIYQHIILAIRYKDTKNIRLLINYLFNKNKIKNNKSFIKLIYENFINHKLSVKKEFYPIIAYAFSYFINQYDPNNKIQVKLLEDTIKAINIKDKDNEKLLNEIILSLIKKYINYSTFLNKLLITEYNLIKLDKIDNQNIFNNLSLIIDDYRIFLNILLPIYISEFSQNQNIYLPNEILDNITQFLIYSDIKKNINIIYRNNINIE